MLNIQRPNGQEGVSKIADGLIEVFSASDIDDLATGGVITVGTGENLTFDLKTDLFISSTRFVLEGTAELRFRTSLADAVYGYSGPDTMISGSGARVSIYNVVLVSISTGALLDITNATFNVQLCAIIGFVSLGSLSGGGNFVIHQSDIANCGAGFATVNMNAVNIDRLSVFLPAMSGNMIEVAPATTRLGNVVVGGVSGDVGSKAVLGLSPAILDRSLASVSDNVLQVGDLFDLTIGLSGSFTAASPASITPEAITSVTDSGGIARFNFSPPPTLYVNQEVALTGFTVSQYNVTGLITAVGAGFFELSFVGFNGNDTGSFSSDSITLTDVGTALSDGDEIVIDTFQSTDYDGGATVYNQTANTFQINREFTTTHSGGWDTSPLNETDPRVISTSNPSFPDSAVKAEVSALGNTLVTDIPAGSALVMINSALWEARTLERVKIDGDGAAILTGNEPISARLDGNILLEPNNSVKSISCQFVRQDSNRVAVSFTNLSNTINETSTPRVDGDNVTFHDTSGVLPTGLRSDIVYYVVNASVNGFQVSYTLGGAAVPFSDDGSGSNSYAVSDLHGAVPVEPIAANNPRTLVPQSLQEFFPNDKSFLIIKNNDDATDIVVTEVYYRVVK